MIFAKLLVIFFFFRLYDDKYILSNLIIQLTFFLARMFAIPSYKNEFPQDIFCMLFIYIPMKTDFFPHLCLIILFFLFDLVALIDK